MSACVHDRLARAERDAALVAEELRAVRQAEVRDRDEEQSLARLLAVIEARADELRAAVAA